MTRRHGYLFVLALVLTLAGCSLNVQSGKPEFGRQNFHYLKPFPEYQAAFDQAKSRFVVLEARRLDGEVTGLASGIWMDKDHILSCFHVLTVDSAIYFQTSSAEGRISHKLDRDAITKVSPVADLVLFYAPGEGPDVTPIKIADDIQVGEELVSYGNANGMGGYMQILHVAENRVGDHPEYNEIYLNEPVFEGMSGSGAYNVKGELAGVMMETFRDTSAKTYSIAFGGAVSQSRLKWFLAPPEQEQKEK